MVNDPGIISRLTGLVGKNLYKDGVLDKNLLSGFMFGNDINVKAVNAIVHPQVKRDFRTWADNLEGKDFCVMESAILFESGFDSEVSYTVCVDAPLEVRIDRCVKRDGTTRDNVIKRMSNQISQSEKCSLCDFVINNDGISDLDLQIGALMENVNKLITNK
jgi:dephospho-CoA kinase